MPPMTPQATLDAAFLVATASATVVGAVQLAKMFLGVDSPRARVATAVIGGFALTLLYAASNGLLTLPNAFSLVIAGFTIAFAGAGVHSVSTAPSAPPSPLPGPPGPP